MHAIPATAVVDAVVSNALLRVGRSDLATRAATGADVRGALQGIILDSEERGLPADELSALWGVAHMRYTRPAKAISMAAELFPNDYAAAICAALEDA